MHDLTFLQSMHAEKLSVIGNVNFTRREIDIISCLLNVRGTSKIAGLLSIAPNTVSSHLHNIHLKIGCNSREGIIDFIEKSHKFPFIKQHYADLVLYAVFEKGLQDVARLNREKIQVYLILYGEDQAYKESFSLQLIPHLKQAGILADILRVENDIESLEVKHPTIRIFLSKKESLPVFNEVFESDFLDISKQSSYYLSVFEILKKLLPNANLDKIMTNFREQYQGLQGFFELEFSKHLRKEAGVISKKKITPRIMALLKSQKRILGFLVFLVGIVYFTTYAFIEGQEMWVAKNKMPGQSKKFSIRSNFVLPSKTSFLDRPELIAHIHTKFKEQQDIPIIALVGPGGSGKTTLARQYGNQLTAPVIWEINAETAESLGSSFENLAAALAKTETDKKTLETLQAIKDQTERESKILHFVKERLKSYTEWLLIYDNIENFTTIQKYFPYDISSWGKGQVLVTTRDDHIKNNLLIRHTLQIGELNPQERLTLFTKIMNNEGTFPFSSNQIAQTTDFLSLLPPFPLDISIAAYYLKSANITYDKYLERLKENSKDFISVQENLLKEASEYKKTRYNIITLSLKYLMGSHKDFEGLLLLISLLDSQNIPRNLLEAYTNGVVIDNFIYHLKKHSLITNELPILSHSTAAFSIHRSTQEIILAYLLSTLRTERKNELLTLISQTLTNYITTITDEKDLSSIRVLLPHSEAFLDHKNLLPNILKSLLQENLGAMYFSLRYFAKGKEILEESLIELERAPKNNYLHIINGLAYLTSIYMELGNYEEAENIIEHRMTPYKKYFKEIHPHIARALTYLGDVSTVLGNYQKAKNLLEQSFELYQKHFPTHYLWLARTSAFLGNVCVELGEYEKAKSLQEKALLIHKTHVLKNRLDTAWQSTFLANTFEKLGYYEKSRLLLEKAIIIAKQYLSENHIDIGGVTVFLGNIYRELGQLEKAKTVLEKTLIVHRETCGEENVRTGSALAALGNVYRDLGQYEKAKSLLNQGIAIREKEFGKDHIKTARILRDLGQTYILEGKLETAETLLRKVLGIFQKNKHPESYQSLELLADLSLKQAIQAMKTGNTQLSEDLREKTAEYFTQALEIVKIHFPKDSPHRRRIELKLQEIQL